MDRIPVGRFFAPVQNVLGPSKLPVKSALFFESNAAGALRLPPPFSAEVKDRVELIYLYRARSEITQFVNTNTCTTKFY